MDQMPKVQIYHNPACGTSRNTLALIQNSGVEPTVILYLETPPDRDKLKELISAMGISVRALLRKNVEPYEQLGLTEDRFTDEELIAEASKWEMRHGGMSGRTAQQFVDSLLGASDLS